MSAKWTADSGALSYYRSIKGHPQCHLSDGTLVFVDYDGAYYYLKWYGHTGSPTTIATLSASFSTPQLSICRDNLNNVYVGGGGGAANSSCLIQAFPYLGSHTWTTSESLCSWAWYYGVWVNSSGCQALLWVNDGGGTGGKGHLLWVGTMYASSGPDVAYACPVFDAGAALAGTCTQTNGSYPNFLEPFYSTNWSEADACASFGLGSTSGIWVGGGGSYVWVGNWSVNSSGVLTNTALGSGYIAAAQGCGIFCLSQSAGHYTVVSRDPSSGYYDATCLTTSSIGSTVSSGAPANMPQNMPYSSTFECEMFLDPITANQFWMIAPGPVVGTSLPVYRLSCNLASGTPSWSSVAVLDDTLTTYAQPVIDIAVVREPVSNNVDYSMDIETASGTYLLAGDYAVFAQTPTDSLLSPISGVYLDGTSAITYNWAYTNIDGSTQAAYALRVKIAGTYYYWNGTNFSSSTIVWNTSSSGSITVPGSVLSNGQQVTWNVNVSSSFGTAEEFTSGFTGGDFVLNLQVAPSCTVTEPSTTQSTSQPTIQYTTTPGAGTSITAYRIVVYPLAVTVAGGFTPGQTSGAAWDSGVVSGAPAGGGTVVGSPLPNEVEYYAYMQVTETNNEPSVWAVGPEWLEAYSLPDMPSLTATNGVDSNGVPCIILVVNETSTGETNPVITITYSDANGSGTVRATSAPTIYGSVIGAPLTMGSNQTYYDYECTPGIARQFWAQVTATAGSATVQSALSGSGATPYVVDATLTVAEWWFIEPLNPSASLGIFVTDNPTSQHENIAVHYPISATGVVVAPTIIAGGISGQDGSLTIETQSLAEWTALKASLVSGTIKWLISPFSAGEYVRVSAANPSGGGTAGATHTTTHPGNVPVTTPVRNSVVTYVQVNAPGAAGLG